MEMENPLFEFLEKIDDKNKELYNIKIDNFEQIENFEELILPIYFHKLIEPITLEEIHNFNYYLITSFKKQMKKLINQLENIAEMPIEIICKYWANAYTLEQGQFYKILNIGLKNKKFKLFLPFIKMIMKELEEKYFLQLQIKNCIVVDLFQIMNYKN